jgi:hypothetical protein
MATVRLWQRFEVSVDGVVHSGGSLTSATDITSTNNEIVDKTVQLATTTATQVLAIGDVTGTTFDFLWLENESSTAAEVIRIQLTVAAGDTDDHLVISMAAGERIVLMGGTARKSATIDTLTGDLDELEEVWAYSESGTPNLRVIAAA